MQNGIRELREYSRWRRMCRSTSGGTSPASGWPAAARARISVDETSGVSAWTRKMHGDAARSAPGGSVPTSHMRPARCGSRVRSRSNDCPGREITTKCARPRTSGYSCHVAISANASVPVMKNKLRGRPPAGLQRAQGHRGERRPRGAKLEVAGDEAIPRAHGKRDHREAMEGRRPRLRRAVRRLVRGDEQDLVEAQRRTGGFRGGQVPDVDRVERAAEHAGSTLSAHWSNPPPVPSSPGFPSPAGSSAPVESVFPAQSAFLGASGFSRTIRRGASISPPAPDDSRPASSGPPRSTILGQTASSSAVHALARDGGDRHQGKPQAGGAFAQPLQPLGLVERVDLVRRHDLRPLQHLGLEEPQLAPDHVEVVRRLASRRRRHVHDVDDDLGAFDVAEELVAQALRRGAPLRSGPARRPRRSCGRRSSRTTPRCGVSVVNG